MADELERLKRRWSASGSKPDMRRYAGALAASGAAARRVERLIDEEVEPADERKAREFLRLAAYVAAWTLSADAEDGTPKRPWAWEASEAGGLDERACVLAVRDLSGGVVIGFARPDERSGDMVEWRRYWANSDVPALRERAETGWPVVEHPGYCWPGLSGAGEEFWGARAWGIHRAYDSRLERTPAIARWASEGASGQVRLDEAEARALVVSVYGFDRSDHDETLAALESGAWRRMKPPALLDDRRDGELGLLFGVQPPPLHGERPENAAGAGWAEWAARRLGSALSDQEAGGRMLATSLEDRFAMVRRATALEALANRKGKLESRDQGVAREEVLVWPAGSVRMRETQRRSLSERLAEKSIMVSPVFPRNMRQGRWGEHDVDKEGLFVITTGHGPFGGGYGAKDRDRAPYGLMGITEVARKVVQDLFPGAKIIERWRW